MATLKSIAENCVVGSEIVFDYIVSPPLKKLMAQSAVEKFGTSLSKLGEPFLGFYTAEEMESLLAQQGMRLLENLTPEQQQQRYHDARRDRVKTARSAYFAHCSVIRD